MVGVFPAREGYIGLHIMPRNWPWFAKAIARPELIEDERFKDAYSRLQNNDELEAIVYEWASRQDPREAYQTAGAARAPIAFVHTIRDLFESSQLRSRDYFQQVKHPLVGEITLPGPPFRMSDVNSCAGRAPLLGEHNEELYCGEMGLSRRHLARLRAAGVV
jgi:crotonobetainyl-CoA:carnitine CoA-transferase CaiB-like acyl-CoA transferase